MIYRNRGDTHHELQTAGRVGSSADELDLADGRHDILLRLEGVQLELHGGAVAEDDGADACRVARHLVLVDDAVHEVQHLREAFAADAARRVDDEDDVQPAAAA